MRRIMVAVDGSEPGRRALARAIDLAGRYRSELVLIHVLAHPGQPAVTPELAAYAQIEHVQLTDADLVRAAAEQLLRQAEVVARESGLSAVTTVLDGGDPASCIASQAKALGVDLIVMGRRGLGSLVGLLLGSVTHKVTQLATCDCLTVA